MPFLLTDSIDLSYRASGLGSASAPIVARTLKLSDDKLGRGVLRVLGQSFKVVKAGGRTPTRLWLGGKSYRWRAESEFGFTRYVADVTLSVGARTAHLSVVSVGNPTELTVFPDYGYVGQAHLDGRTYTAEVTGELTPNALVWIDRNGDGVRQTHAEVIAADAPFNLTGTTHRLVLSSHGYAVQRSSTSVARTPDAPDLRAGATFASISLKTSDGRTIRIPEDFRGKLVLLDFWATWCPPCLAALPEIGKAYARFRDVDLEVVSVDLDSAEVRSRAEALAKSRGIVWIQAYESGGFKGPTAEALGLEAIPKMLLVDGDTGRIVATETELSKTGIEPAIEAALRKKRGSARISPRS